jgi:hypothetical protein
VKVQARFAVSETRACRLIGQHRSAQRYQSRRAPGADIRMRIREIAAARPRYGSHPRHARADGGAHGPATLKAAAQRYNGLFSAWLDEMSGTLRCSVCSARSASDLPFACLLDVTTSSIDFAKLVIASPYAHGIPNEELNEIGDVEGEEVQQRFRLAVLVRPLIGVADPSS